MDTDTDTTITEIKISQDQLETIQRILGSSFLRSVKKERLLALTGLKHLLCCVCGQTTSPLYEVKYSGHEYVKIQVYCTAHLESVYQATKGKTNAEIAASLGIQLVGEIPHTQREPWD
jgi:hypothetical protein